MALIVPHDTTRSTTRGKKHIPSHILFQSPPWQNGGDVSPHHPRSSRRAQDAERVMASVRLYNVGIHERVFENKSVIKKKSFGVTPFFKKVASSEAFWKNLHQKPL
ncbi:hypothetical protein [Novacetimonas hansenii]|uniref:hypothetical protein n=1 Tax=Novacetimonas hansenii TaxID=436 RepID=UPI0011150667|nr:hypothetical protein [Novacetimonas hansenii]